MVSPNSFSSFKSNVKSIIPSSTSPSTSNTQGAISNAQNTEDALITSCRNSFNECNDIVNQKFSLSYSLVKMQKFEDLSGASEFVRTWQSYSVPNLPDSAYLSIYCDFSNCSQELPFVLIAIKGTNAEGVTASLVIFCDESGELNSYSKSQAGC